MVGEAGETKRRDNRDHIQLLGRDRSQEERRGKSLLLASMRLKTLVLIGIISEQCKKGDNIGQFLEKCRAQFPELRGTSVDNMMYIKEDLIIPHVSCAIS